jgi:P27 family predicted phage terminase small subunit
MQAPPAPAHLSASARELWTTTLERYELEQHHLRLLQLLCEAWDRAQAARAQVDAEGLIVAAKSGPRAHPCIAIERDSRLAVARLTRELDLDREPPVSDRIGPPAIASNSNRNRSHARKAPNA